MPRRAMETVVVPPGPEPPTARTTSGLLINASFENGTAYFFDGTHERMVPTDWTFSYHNESEAPLPRQTAPFGKPITALINSRSVADSDRARVFAGGRYCWKVAGGNAPIWIRLVQGVAGLPPGRSCRFTVNILPDLILRTHPQLAYAGDPLSGEALLTATFPERTFETGWKTGAEVPFGRYTRVTLDFLPPSTRVEVALEVRSRWALPLGAWYIDEMSLDKGEREP